MAHNNYSNSPQRQEIDMPDDFILRIIWYAFGSGFGLDLGLRLGLGAGSFNYKGDDGNNSVNICVNEASTIKANEPMTTVESASHFFLFQSSSIKLQQMHFVFLNSRSTLFN